MLQSFILPFLLPALGWFLVGLIIAWFIWGGNRSSNA
jgi:hypothetical protein